MSCLYEMGDWESLYEITETLWNETNKQWNIQSERKKINKKRRNNFGVFMLGVFFVFFMFLPHYP